MSMGLPIFDIGSGPDRLLLRYNPESILALAKTIEAAHAMGMADPMPEQLQTELEGRLALPTPA
jgi:hypothetical protein